MSENIKEIDTAVENENDFSLDAVLIRIGQFGRFQIIVFLLICVPMLFNAIFSVAYVFTASSVVYRCNISECDNAESQYQEPWLSYAIPMDGNNINQCKRYAPNTTIEEVSDQCEKRYFNTHETIGCPDTNFIFRDKENTISNEFGIFCGSEWKLSLVGTVNNIGQFVGIPIGGVISDKYGRRISLAVGGFLSAIFGILRSFSPTYAYFLIFEFLDNVCCSTLYTTCFIIGIELVGPSKRVIACCWITIFYAIGEILLAMAASFTQDWRFLLRLIYIPALVMGAYLWLLPESVRWLLSQNRCEDARFLLKKAAKINKRTLSDNFLEKVLAVNQENLKRTTHGKFPIKQAFGQFFWRISNCCLCWIVNVLVYYGLSLNSVLLAGNKYTNFMLTALVEIPGFFLPYATMDRFGRRYSLFGYMVISGACCLSTIFISSDENIPQLILFLFGKLAITSSFQVLYFFTSEIFPTTIRNSLLSFCSMVGRIGSMIAPQIPLLAQYNPDAPSFIFGVAAFVSGCLTLFFPETTNLVLPTTIEEANSIGLKKTPVSPQAETNIL